jgi:hypothetical protein
MTDTPEEKPRPTPRPRPGATARPTPRPRVAGSRRDRDDAADTGPRTGRSTPTPAPRPRPAARKSASAPGATATATKSAASTARKGARAAARDARTADARSTRRVPRLVLALVALCLLAGAAAGFLFWQRLNPTTVDASVFSATESNVQDLYAFDYQDAEGSVERKLDALTGELRDQYETELDQGGILDTYQQVSATVRFEVVDVGLQQINEAQDAATLVVFGQQVLKTVNSGTQPAPEGSECQVTPDGAQSCTYTVQVDTIKVDGEWKINEVSLRTTS